MLISLTINNIVLFQKLDIEFNDGLCVMTGETGAGKSIILDALGLSIGLRGDATLVRHGYERGSVSASFHLSDNRKISELLNDHDIEHIQGEDLVLRRIQSTDGRTKAYINDQPVTINLLRNIGSNLIEIHGQHDTLVIKSKSYQLDLLDVFANNQEKIHKLSNLWSEYNDCKNLYNKKSQSLEENKRLKEELEFEINKLKELNPLAGEEIELDKSRKIMMNSEKLSQNLTEALDNISGDNGAQTKIDKTLSSLERIDDDVELLKDPNARLGQLSIELEELRLIYCNLQERAIYNPEELENIENRLFELRALARKYQSTTDELPNILSKLEINLHDINTSDEILEKLKVEMMHKKDEYFKIASEISQIRQEVASALDKKIQNELKPLKLEKVIFETRVIEHKDENKANIKGINDVSFYIATNPGQTPAPLNKIASGGELSRIMLALKVTLAEKHGTASMIFDEIDTGIGGAVADAIGERLSRLGNNSQTIAVTHSPQIAARGDQHIKITKSISTKKDSNNGDEAANYGDDIDEAVNINVESLSENQRLEEIARMLAGATITDEARAAAKSLLLYNNLS